MIKRDVTPGQTVSVNLKAETLFKIANDLRQIEVHGPIDKADVGRLKEGPVATFMVDACPERSFTGRVAQIRRAAEVRQNVVAYMAVIAASNPEQVLFPGMMANLRVTMSEMSDILKVPNRILRAPSRHKGIITA